MGMATENGNAPANPFAVPKPTIAIPSLAFFRVTAFSFAQYPT
jgi:hypothetical protein